MQRDAIFQDRSNSIYIGTDSMDRAQVEFQVGALPGWILTTEDAERVCLQILTDRRESLTLDRIRPGPGSDQSAGALLVQKQGDGWILAHSSKHDWGGIWLELDLERYQSYWRKLVAHAPWPSWMPRLAQEPELSPDLESMQVWELKRLDAQRMALAILEGIGRQCWIPALSIAASKRRIKRLTAEDVILNLAIAFVFLPLICIGVAVLVLRVMNWAIGNWLDPIPYSFTDVLLVAILVGVSFTMWGAITWLQELVYLLRGD